MHDIAHGLGASGRPQVPVKRIPNLTYVERHIHVSGFHSRFIYLRQHFLKYKKLLKKVLSFENLAAPSLMASKYQESSSNPENLTA
jgi:hypothetical protein